MGGFSLYSILSYIRSINKNTLSSKFGANNRHIFYFSQLYFARKGDIFPYVLSIEVFFTLFFNVL